jgi:hypothetical protein
MVTGYKQGVYEKAFVSRIYNGLSRSLFDIPVRDLNSVKAYRREVMDMLPVRPDWHRYMIVIAAENGFTVTEIPVPLYPRNAGVSKFGIGRIPIGVLAGFVALAIRVFWGIGFRPLLNLVEICVITGSVFLVGGLVGEMIAGQRAELRELRRLIDVSLPRRDGNDR